MRENPQVGRKQGRQDIKYVSEASWMWLNRPCEFEASLLHSFKTDSCLKKKETTVTKFSKAAKRWERARGAVMPFQLRAKKTSKCGSA